ncbi:MAG: glycoside hydrolase family 3 protein, partial [Anaerolineaceae bacterium]
MHVDLTPEQAIGQKLLLAFSGKDRPASEFIQALLRYRAGGITLFRHLNVDHPAQVRQLTDALQSVARENDMPPLLIAADQEGGQLMAIGSGTTALPGNMALGATGSTELAFQAGLVLGNELAAMGINVNYAPCCDVNVNPHNPVIGTRSFGEDPLKVAQMAAAMIKGIQSAGVAATAKHFPGHGDTSSDSHLKLPHVLHSLEELRAVDLPPFNAAVRAGVKIVMSGHLALPVIDGPRAPPATLSARVLNGMLRGDLGFEGVIVSDALDMKAIRQGKRLGETAVRAAAAGVDLFLLTDDPLGHQRVYDSLIRAEKDGRLPFENLAASAARILSMKRWIASHAQPYELDVIGSTAHREVADEIARRSITIVRDREGLLPIRLDDKKRIVIVLPRPVDLTPADTSSYVVPALGKAVRQFHPNTDELIIPHDPDAQEIAKVLHRLPKYDLILLATINANDSPGQATLIRQALELNHPLIVAALRLPYDLTAFPDAPVFV